MRKFAIGSAFVIFQSVLVAGSHHLTENQCLNMSNYFKQLPKTELHLHLGGAYPLKYLFSISTSRQQEELKENLDLIHKGVAYHDVFRFFQLISQIVNTEERVQNGVEALCLSLEEDGVTYAEIRTGLKDLGHGFEEYLKAALNGTKSKAFNQIRAYLLLSLQRNSSPEMAKTTVDLALKYQHLGVLGIDISGDSSLGQIELIMPELLRAKEGGLSLVVHIGESRDEIGQLHLLEKLHPHRIGHGVHLSADAKEWILKHRVPLEVCLTSSFLVKMVDQPSQHPGIEYFYQGHPIVFCTDDPLLFSTIPSQELSLAHRLCGLSLEDITKITENSFRVALKHP